MVDNESVHPKIAGLLGLAQRARKIASGEFSVDAAIKEGKAFLVLVAKDASDNTKKHFLDKCNYYEIPFLMMGTKESLAKVIGKEERSSVAVLDEGLSQGILRYTEESNGKN